MGRYRASTGLREIINEKRSVSLGVAVVMVGCAVAYFAYVHRPQSHPKGDKAFYTIDDGQSWFTDSIFRTPPFKHEGKLAVRAMVYSYDNGRHEFCPLLQRYTSDMKESLDDAAAQAVREGKPLSSIPLFSSPAALDGIEVKAAGPGHEWVSRGDADEASKVLNSVKSPDGSAVDFVIP
jgi:hypothetical protein